MKKEMEKEIITKVIYDLYEMRVSTFHKYSSKDELVMDNHKYHFFTSAIAQLCDKYKIKDEDIRNEGMKRQFNRESPHSTHNEVKVGE